MVYVRNSIQSLTEEAKLDTFDDKREWTMSRTRRIRERRNSNEFRGAALDLKIMDGVRKWRRLKCGLAFS